MARSQKSVLFCDAFCFWQKPESSAMSEEISIRVKSMDDRVETIAIKLTDMVSILREKVHTKFGSGGTLR